MVDLVRLLRSLPRRSPTELVGRGRQAAAVALERAGLSSLTRLPSDDALVRMWGGRAEGVDDLLADFRSRPATMFLPAFGDTSATIAAFRQRWRARTDAIIAAAERAAGGRINLLGWRDVDVGDPPDWHRDPVLGVRSPRLHWSRIHYLEPTVVGDHKLVWEINRHQHFSLLGRAYLLTGEARFAEAFVRHVTDWMDANPPKAGVNWASSLEVALRAIAWIWALHFFRDSDPLRPEVFSRLLRYLYLHGRHIETYLSTYFSPNTHLTGEALGLIYLGSVFPELDRADHWRRLGWRILLDGLDRQVHEDGVYFERAACYHRYTVDFCVHARLLAGLTRDARAARLDPLLDALFEHLLHLTRPDGRVPAVGDDDGGRLLPLSDGPPADARPALAVGSVLLRRPDLAAVAGEDAAEELLWLLGPGAVERFERMERRRPSRTAAAFADGRFYVARDGWSEHANYIIIDAGAGGGPTGGHAHANPLGVELSACGTPVIVDPGTFTYTVDDGLRDHFRGSIAHNTVSIDGEPAALPGSAFGWRRLPKVRTDRWLARERFTLFEGEHDGFTRLSAPAVHRRAILFLKGGYWIIRDRIDSTGRHRVDVRYQFAPGALVD
ncbi:MAG: alginate lyase family protein, partial [Gemmatimonadota bacterium]